MIVILPGALVKLAPERDTVCDVELVPVVTEPNELIVPRVNPGVATPQVIGVEELLRGIGAVMISKSLLLLSVS